MVSERVWSRTVCVIGAGPAGLVAARELRKEGHAVTVVEKSHDVGGQWLYNPDVADSIQCGGVHSSVYVDSIQCGGVHSSVYASLRLVSPRETMGFTDFPFSAKKGRDSRRFPGHREVYLYLSDFCDCFALREMIRFNTRVDYVGMVNDDADRSRWVVITREFVGGGENRRAVVKEEVFDAVVVATGHYSFPKLPSLKGMDSWKRKQMHSHFYRVPEPYHNEVVVIVGNSLSGQDLSMELVDVAKDVYVSARSMETITEGLSKVIAKHQNLHLRPQIECLEEDGKVLFVDGSWVIADTIIYCTGYSYTFPFLDTKGIVRVEDDKVGPLFEHTFPPSLAPSLTFIGIPKKIIGFPFFESQAKWIAQVLSGRKTLPSYGEMMKSINEFYLSKQPNENIHDIADFEYCDKYSDYVGFPHLEDWRKVLCKSAIINSLVNLETYRDSYDHDHDLLLQAFESAHFTQQPESQSLST